MMELRNCSLDSNLDALTGLKCVERSSKWSADQMQHVITLIVLIALTLLGNISVICVLLCTRFRQLGRVHLFIVNLAFADLAVCLVTMTSEILLVVLDSWVLGNAACKIVLWLQVVTLASTTFILVAMSYDR